MNRFVVGLKAFWKSLTNREFAERVEPLFHPVVTGPDLRILAVLQRDGRLVDFLREEIEPYSDAQIGAAVRDIHRGCRKALLEYVALEPVLPQAEDSPVDVPAGFDPAAIRLTGNIGGSAPYRGTLKHHGWKVRNVHLPELPRTRDQVAVIAPAEVEVV